MHESATRAYDERAVALADAGSTLVARVCEYDRYAAFMNARDTTARRDMVARIRRFLEAKYRHAYANVADGDFRRSMLRMFNLAEGRDRRANTIQMLIIHTAVLLEAEVARALCPPEPNPDDEDAVDAALVDRLVFTTFEQRYLRHLFRDLCDGTTVSVGSFVEELNGAYSALLPSNPETAATTFPYNRRRRIVFSNVPPH